MRIFLPIPLLFLSALVGQDQLTLAFHPSEILVKRPELVLFTLLVVVAVQVKVPEPLFMAVLVVVVALARVVLGYQGKEMLAVGRVLIPILLVAQVAVALVQRGLLELLRSVALVGQD
jgi:hypothetical protein